MRTEEWRLAKTYPKKRIIHFHSLHSYTTIFRLFRRGWTFTTPSLHLGGLGVHVCSHGESVEGMISTWWQSLIILVQNIFLVANLDPRLVQNVKLPPWGMALNLATRWRRCRPNLCQWAHMKNIEKVTVLSVNHHGYQMIHNLQKDRTVILPQFYHYIHY